MFLLSSENHPFTEHYWNIQKRMCFHSEKKKKSSITKNAHNKHAQAFQHPHFPRKCWHGRHLMLCCERDGRQQLNRDWSKTRQMWRREEEGDETGWSTNRFKIKQWVALFMCVWDSPLTVSCSAHLYPLTLVHPRPWLARPISPSADLALPCCIHLINITHKSVVCLWLPEIFWGLRLGLFKINFPLCPFRTINMSF